MSLMNEEKEEIRIFNKASTKTVRRRWNCPSDAQLAKYLEQGLGEEGRLRFEAHLADCSFCLSAVSDVVRGQRPSAAAEVPSDLLQQAITLVPLETAWRPSWKWILVPTLASIVVMSFAVLKSRRPDKTVASISAAHVETVQETAKTTSPPSRPSEKQYMRSLAPPRSVVEPLEPRSGSVVASRALTFRWREVRDTDYYEVGVVNAAGDLIWRSEGSNTSAQVPHTLSLAPGKYFFWVHAYLNDGRTLKSDAITFWVRKPS